MEQWKFIARAASVEEVRYELVAWSKAQGMAELPPRGSVRWHHGLSGDGEYWDVWVLNEKQG